MRLDIEGRRAIVLGAGGGLGSAVVKSLAAEGVRVAACHRSPVSHESFSDEDLVSLHHLDLSDIDSIGDVIEEIVTRLSGVDILVNITGGPPVTPATDIPTETWRKHFDSMVVAVLRITDLVLPAMRSAGWGRIITCSSSGIIAPIPNLMVSNTLRASLRTWSKTLALEVGQDGITVNTVIPGRIATARVRQLDRAKALQEGISEADVAAKSIGTIPLRRYGDPREFADVVTFLCSERASFITGSTVRVDGGMISSV